MTPFHGTGRRTRSRAGGLDTMTRLRAANPVPAPSTTPPVSRVVAPLLAPTLDRRALDDLERILDLPRHPEANELVHHSAVGTAVGGVADRAVGRAPARPGFNAGSQPRPRAGSATGTSPRWRHRLPLGVAAVGAVAAIVVGVGLTQPGSAPIAHADTPPALVITAPPATIDGAQTLHELASLAAQQPAVDRAPYLFTEAINYTVNTSFGDAGTTVEVVPSRSQVWLAPDGQVHRESVSAGASDEWSSNGVIDPALISSEGAWTSDFTAAARDRADTLPTDPAALLVQLNSDGPGTDGGLSAGYLADLFNRFQNGLPTPTQQAAIWQVLADTGTFKTLGETTDRAGRAAVAVSYDTTGAAAGQLRYQLLISPSTGLLLGFEQITLKQTPQWQQQVPAVTGATTFLRIATAERPGTVPAQ